MTETKDPVIDIYNQYLQPVREMPTANRHQKRAKAKAEKVQTKKFLAEIKKKGLEI